MAACDSLQPIVLLSDVMDASTEPVLAQTIEQTEPLDLCLLKNFEIDANAAEEDADVVFVKEYKANKEKSCRRLNGHKTGTPRRNPARKARDANRFQEYVDESYGEDELTEDNFEEVDCVEDDSFARNEDLEDWKVEKVPRRSKQKKKFTGRRVCSNKPGRKRKVTKTAPEEQKIPMKEIEVLVESNLLLIKDYIVDIKTVNSISNKETEKEQRTNTAIDLLRHQLMLLAVTKNLNDSDVRKYLTD